MSYARQMLDTYPRTFNVDADLLAAAIDALDDCAQACNADNTADLSEQNVVEMVTCIRLCLDCVDVCTATSRVIGRQTEYDASLTRPLLESCVAVCRSCGDECERHAHMPHCRVCAEACRRCEQACRELLESAGPGHGQGGLIVTGLTGRRVPVLMAAAHQRRGNHEVCGGPVAGHRELQTTATRSRALTSGSCGCGSSGSHRNTSRSISPSAIRAPICWSPP